jgi:hypothetical protein
MQIRMSLATPLRGLAVSTLCAAALFTPVAANAASTGTLVGHVTCGPAEDAPAAHAVVNVDGLAISTHTDGAGTFQLSVPAAQPFTLDASTGDGAFQASRYNVVVRAGETLDVGSIDLAVCPSPAPADQPSQLLNEEQPSAEFASY